MSHYPYPRVKTMRRTHPGRPCKFSHVPFFLVVLTGSDHAEDTFQDSGDCAARATTDPLESSD